MNSTMVKTGTNMSGVCSAKGPLEAKWVPVMVGKVVLSLGSGDRVSFD